MRKIFGREPAIVAALIEAAVLCVTAFGLDWSAEQVTGVNAAVSAALAVYVYWGTVDSASAAIIQLAKALLVVVAGFGANLTPDRTAALLGLVTVAVAAFTRTQVSAVVPPPPTPVVPGSVPVTEVR